MVTDQDWYALITKQELTIFKESKYNKIPNIEAVVNKTDTMVCFRNVFWFWVMLYKKLINYNSLSFPADCISDYTKKRIISRGKKNRIFFSLIWRSKYVGFFLGKNLLLLCSLVFSSVKRKIRVTLESYKSKGYGMLITSVSQACKCKNANKFQYQIHHNAFSFDF